jgi:hypothetical protein
MPEASSGPRALPASLPEWKYVDRSQPFWAVRHFDNSRADVDPTNPHNGGVGTEQIEASGLVVEFQPSATFARMIVPAGVTAGDNPWKQLTGAPDFQGEASSRELAKGVWEIKAEGVAQTQFMAVFAFMAQLGFAVLL